MITIAAGLRVSRRIDDQMVKVRVMGGNFVAQRRSYLVSAAMRLFPQPSL